MKKIAIVTDSNSGITQAQAKDLGIRVIPMPFTIDGTEYFEEISLSQDEFYKKLEDDAQISTSMPALGHVMEIWDDLLKENDEVVYIPMSSGLSSSCHAAMSVADEYDGKVQVVNNQRISVTQKLSVYDAIELAKAGKDAKEIKTILEDQKMESSIYIMVNTLKYLKAGGRITPAAAAIGTILNLKPVLQIQGEKLDAFSKCRGIKQARKIMLQAIVDDQKDRFPGCFENGKMHFAIAHTQNEEAAMDFKNEILEIFPGSDIMVDPLSLSVSCHIGPGALALACSKYIEY